MKAKLGIPPRWNRAPLLLDGALPKFNALVGRHPPGAERRAPPAECMRPDYGFDDARAEVRAAPAVSGRLEAGSTSNLWFHGSQGLRVEIELPQGPDLSTISDIAMFLLRIVRNYAKVFAGQNSWQEPACRPTPPGAFAFVHPRSG
jgi:hypothetical protein